MKKRLISLALAAAMLIAVLSAAAGAVDVGLTAARLYFGFDDDACDVTVHITYKGGETDSYQVKPYTSYNCTYDADVILEVKMNTNYKFNYAMVSNQDVDEDYFYRYDMVEFTTSVGDNYVFIDTDLINGPTKPIGYISCNPATKSVPVGSYATLTASSTNVNGNVTYYWYLDNPYGSPVDIGDTYLYAPYEVGQRTVYMVARNSYGGDYEDSDYVAATIVATANVAAPVITLQPANTAVNTGVKTTLSAAAVGTGLSYRWQYFYNNDWIDLSDATLGGFTVSGSATPSITATGAAAGTFGLRCKISNTAGTVYTNIASLTVYAQTDVDINSVIVGAINPPVKGASSDTTGVAGNASYKVGSVRWTPNDATFKSATIYTAIVTLRAADGYVFGKSCTAKIGGSTASVMSGAGTKELIISLQFPKTEADAPTYVFPFTDVPSGSWYRKYVETANKNGLIVGTTATTFSPEKSITIGEVVKLAACIHQLYNDGSVTLAAGKPWYKPFMEYALKNNIIPEDYSSRQDEVATREEFVYILYNSLPASEYEKICKVKAVPDYAYNANDPYSVRIYAFYEAGIVSGDTNHYFNAKTSIKRAEVASILTRMVYENSRVVASIG